jgi:fermentation-respiration switch protein FrsA (DUF1100 family)
MRRCASIIYGGWRAGLRRTMTIFLTLAGIAVGLYLTVTVAAYFLQRKLLYFPDATYVTPAEEDLDGVDEVKLATPDGETLIAWHSQARPGMPTILYFHGNGGHIAIRGPRLQRFSSVGLGVFMPAYRGYSGSTGSPSESAIVADAQLAYDHLRKSGLAARDILVYGESLGSGVATQLAASREVGALILDAPFTSVPDVGKLMYPFLPVEHFTIDRYESKRHIGQVKAPILILHGTEDTIIPVEMGRALFRLAPEPKEMIELKGAGHSDIYMFGAFEPLRRFIDRIRKNRQSAETGSAAIR